MEKEKYVGKVIWFSNSKGFGFISRSGEKDLFVHYSDISCEGYRSLKKDQEVAFSIGKNHRGEDKAIDVVVINATPKKT